MAAKPKPITLPPLEPDEIDAILLGLAVLAEENSEEGYEDEEEGDENDADDGPNEAVQRALDKIASVLPPPPAPGAVLSGQPPRTPREMAAFLRCAMEAERTVRLAYVDRKGAPSDRVVWPVDVYGDHAGDTFAAWCEARAAFRNFRFDRVRSMEATGAAFPMRQRIVRLRWIRQMNRDEW